MFRLACLGIGYLIGCFQTAYLVGRLAKKIDIRDHGSGNAGMTNVTRVMGFKFGAIVFGFDVLKAILGFSICALLLNGAGSFFGGISYLPGLFGGVGVILGHNFPIFLKFRGGKGIAASIGIIIALDLRVAGVVFLGGIIVVLLTKYISAASLTITGLLPFAMLFFRFDTESVIIGFVIMFLAFFSHRKNIVRLIKGTESKFTFKPKIE